METGAPVLRHSRLPVAARFYRWRLMKTESQELLALAPKIQAGVNATGRYLATQPAELRVLRQAKDLHAFAETQGWVAVLHLADSIEFFKGVEGQYR